VYSNDSITGALVCPTYGGQTVRTEFEILTGLSVDAFNGVTLPYIFVKNDISTYISYYRDLGYRTMAIHPNSASFYTRDKTLPRLGFDEFYGIEELKRLDIEIEYGGPYISDNTLVKFIGHYMNDRSGNTPTLLFAISMENHFPYPPDKYKNFSIETQNSILNKADLGSFRTYVQGAYDADRALGELCSLVDDRTRPTVLLFFGDHLPSLGTRTSAYLDSGFITSDSNYEDNLKLHSTPFAIYANFELDKHVLADGGAVSAYNLLNVLSSSIGAGGSPHMAFLRELYGELPFYNGKLAMETNAKQDDYLQWLYRITYKTLTDK